MAKAVCDVDGNRVSARAPVDPGFEVRCRACGSFRLQKSTSGAWPRSARVRRAPGSGLGLAASSFTGAGRRKSVGSRAEGGEAQVPVAGPRSRSAVARAAEGRAGTRRWKASRVVRQPEPLTRLRRRRSSAACCVLHGAVRAATGGVRGRCARLARGRQRRGTRGRIRGLSRSGAHQDRTRPALAPVFGRRRDRMRASVEARGAPSSAP